MFLTEKPHHLNLQRTALKHTSGQVLPVARGHFDDITTCSKHPDLVPLSCTLPPLSPHLLMSVSHPPPGLPAQLLPLHCGEHDVICWRPDCSCVRRTTVTFAVQTFNRATDRTSCFTELLVLCISHVLHFKGNDSLCDMCCMSRFCIRCVQWMWSMRASGCICMKGELFLVLHILSSIASWAVAMANLLLRSKSKCTACSTKTWGTHMVYCFQHFPISLHSMLFLIIHLRCLHAIS